MHLLRRTLSHRSQSGFDRLISLAVIHDLMPTPVTLALASANKTCRRIGRVFSVYHMRGDGWWLGLEAAAALKPL